MKKLFLLFALVGCSSPTAPDARYILSATATYGAPLPPGSTCRVTMRIFKRSRQDDPSALPIAYAQVRAPYDGPAAADTLYLPSGTYYGRYDMEGAATVYDLPISVLVPGQSDLQC